MSDIDDKLSLFYHRYSISGEDLRKALMLEELENVKCPLCNGDMIPRKSQYGKFWGCKSYPKCKGTRNADGEVVVKRGSDNDNPNDEPERVSFRRRYE